MPEPDPDKALGESAEELRAQLAGLVKRSLMQIGDMREIESKMAELSERILKKTPPPDPPQTL
jgi:hypothetical protein